jgi:DNA-binding transcriptional regulator YiaG
MAQRISGEKAIKNGYIRALRLKLGMTQIQFGMALACKRYPRGADDETVGNWERGLRSPSPIYRFQIERLAAVNRISIPTQGKE